MSLRSRTGCTSCKRRRQKCDETHPECKRCVRLGLQCHYPHLEKLKSRANRPLRPAPSSRPLCKSAEAPAKACQPASTGSSSQPRSAPQISPDLGFSASVSPERLPNELPNSPFTSQGHVSSVAFNFPLPSDGSWHSTRPPTASTQSPTQAVPVKYPIRDHVYPDQPIHSDHRALVLAPNSHATSERYSISTSPADCSSSTFSGSTTLGQAGLLQLLLSLASPKDDTLTPNPIFYLETSANSLVSTCPPLHSAEASEDADEEDPEGVGRVMCDVPRLDYTVESNTLAFVLQSYAKWFNLTVFDPLRVARLAKENIVRQFLRSEGDRKRIMLVANAFATLGRTSDLNSDGLRLVSSLRTDAHRGIAMFNATQPSFLRELDIPGALRVLENLLEILSVHFCSSSFRTIACLMRHAAPVFRRACPEPADQLPNLPNMLLEPGFHRRYFAATDVLLSVTSARPMLFRYDVTYPLDFSNQELPCEYGLEWMHGIPDHSIVIFAWINSLVEDSLATGIPVDPECVTKIEELVDSGARERDFAESDPFLRVGRVVVREYWRQATLIYLYMTLCGAHAKDPRVEQAFTRSMKLIEMTRPARKPDTFLAIPMILTGVAAHNQADRDTLQRRMLGTRECSVAGLIGHESVQILNDLWARTDNAGRPATWSDYKASCERVVGM